MELPIKQRLASFPGSPPARRRQQKLLFIIVVWRESLGTRLSKDVAVSKSVIWGRGSPNRMGAPKFYDTGHDMHAGLASLTIWPDPLSVLQCTYL